MHEVGSNSLEISHVLFKLPYIQDSVTNEDIIVVTGGEKDGGPEGTLDSVELLFQFNQNYWVSGRCLSINVGPF